MSIVAGTSPRNISGFTLLEILIALVILSIGMLGIAGLLITAQKANSSSYLKQEAMQAGYDILDRMRANPAEAYASAYDISLTGTPSVATDCIANACTPSQLAAYDVAFWRSTQELGQLPNGTGSITTQQISAAGVTPTVTQVTVVMQWDDNSASQLGTYLGSAGLCTTTGSTSTVTQCTLVTRI
jgi:type IV pilus assembly protein PilV